MPTFFDSHAYYVCLMQHEILLKKFENYDITDDGTIKK